MEMKCVSLSATFENFINHYEVQFTLLCSFYGVANMPPYLYYVKKNISKTILILILLICFGIQVRDAVSKFFRGQTTIAATTEYLSEFELPVLSVCPGYKHDNYFVLMEEYEEILKNNEDINANDIMTWWNNETYDVADVLKSIRGSGPWLQTNETTINITGFYKDLNTTIKLVPSPYGRCYSIYFHNKLKSMHEYYGITLNTAIISEVTIYLHEKHNEIGLLWSYWPIPPVTFVVKAKDHLLVTVQKDTHTTTSSFSELPCSKDDFHSYPECVTKWVRKEYVNLFAKHNKTGCWYPSGLYLIDNPAKPMHACKTLETERFARTNGFNLMEKMENQEENQCRHKCQQTCWKVDVICEPVSATSDNTAFFSIDATMISEHHEDVVIYDLNNVVAAVGGSLGLFLGVSCLSICSYACKKVSQNKGCLMCKKEDASSFPIDVKTI